MLADFFLLGRRGKGWRGKGNGPGENAEPKNEVAEHVPAAHPASTDGDEGQLRHLRDHQIAAQLLEDAPHDEFVHAGAEQKGDEGGRGAGDAQRADGRVVDVPQQKGVHGPVPVARELVPRRAVPPVAVEAAVGEQGEFRQHVELLFIYTLEGERERRDQGKTTRGMG